METSAWLSHEFSKKMLPGHADYLLSESDTLPHLGDFLKGRQRFVRFPRQQTPLEIGFTLQGENLHPQPRLGSSVKGKK